MKEPASRKEFETLLADLGKMESEERVKAVERQRQLDQARLRGELEQLKSSRAQAKKVKPNPEVIESLQKSIHSVERKLSE